MSANEALNASIIRLRKRVRLLFIERFSLIGISMGMLAAGVIVLFSTRFDQLLNYELWAATVFAGLLIGTAYGAFKKFDDLAVAIAADKRTGMKERLSTAVALQDDSDEMVKALVQDAEEHTSGMRPNQVFRHKFGIAHAVFGISLLLFLASIFAPQLPMFQSKTRRQEVAVMKREGKKLVRISKELKGISAPHENLRKLSYRLEALGKKMETGRMTRKQAMLHTQRLNKEILKEQDRLAKLNSQKKSMDQAQAQMRRASADLADKISHEIAKKENIPPSEAMKKVPSDKRLAELARKEGPLTESERKKLENAVKKSLEAENDQQIAVELGEALSKLAQNGDYQKALSLMQQVAKKLGSKNLSPMNREMLREQMKQLAQALSNTNLDKLAKQLKENAQQLANMSQADLQNLLKEVEQAQKLAKAGGT